MLNIVRKHLRLTHHLKYEQFLNKFILLIVEMEVLEIFVLVIFYQLFRKE